jgi:uncharacterized RDD family membrane protein YckC
LVVRRQKAWRWPVSDLTSLDYSRVKASFGPRFGALLVDGLIALPGYLAYIIPGLLIFGFRDSFTNQQSIGRKVTETRLLLVTTGEEPSAGQKFARNLLALLLRSLTVGVYSLIELLVHLGRADGRCLTDLMFGTVVVSLERMREVHGTALKPNAALAALPTAGHVAAHGSESVQARSVEER